MFGQWAEARLREPLTPVERLVRFGRRVKKAVSAVKHLGDKPRHRHKSPRTPREETYPLADFGPRVKPSERRQGQPTPTAPAKPLAVRDLCLNKPLPPTPLPSSRRAHLPYPVESFLFLRPRESVLPLRPVHASIPSLNEVGGASAPVPELPTPVAGRPRTRRLKVEPSGEMQNVRSQQHDILPACLAVPSPRQLQELATSPWPPPAQVPRRRAVQQAIPQQLRVAVQPDCYVPPVTPEPPRLAPIPYSGGWSMDDEFDHVIDLVRNWDPNPKRRSNREGESPNLPSICAHSPEPSEKWVLFDDYESGNMPGPHAWECSSSGSVADSRLTAQHGGHASGGSGHKSVPPVSQLAGAFPPAGVVAPPPARVRRAAGVAYRPRRRGCSTPLRGPPHPSQRPEEPGLVPRPSDPELLAGAVGSLWWPDRR